MRRVLLVLTLVAATFTARPAPALPVSLQRLLINANGTLDRNANQVPGVNAGASDASTGLGTLVFEFDGNNPVATQIFIGGSIAIVPFDVPSPTAVPEPRTLVLLGTGLIALGRWARRKKR